MLPRADLNTTRPPATVEAPTPIVPTGDARNEVFERLTQIAIGRQLQAEVLSLFEDGTFLVRVADTAARMSLPVGTKVGDNLSMVFVAKEPRPTFLLTAQEGGSAPANLSSVGKLVNQLVQEAQEHGSPTAIQPRTPLLLSPTMMKPETVASAMRESVEHSGLFYESHLHDWISGSRPLANLQREPQAQLPQQSQVPHPPAGIAPQELAQLDLGKLSTDLKELGAGAQMLMNLIREAQVQASQAQQAAPPAASAPGIPVGAQTTDAMVISQPQQAMPTIQPEAAFLINQQLSALEHQRVLWQGELWPGMPMEWEITEDGSHRRSPDAPESTWSSQVRFSLPTLGDISASIRLLGDRVHVQIDAGDENVAGLLRSQSPALADALAAAGSPLESFLVKRHGTS